MAGDGVAPSRGRGSRQARLLPAADGELPVSAKKRYSVLSFGH